MKAAIIQNKLILSCEENDTVIHSMTGIDVNEIIIESGAVSIRDRAFGGFYQLKVLHIPKTVTSLGSAILPSYTKEIQICYEGSSEAFLEMGKEEEVYVSGAYDHYPYYSDYGATYETRQFCRNGTFFSPCKVFCKEDGVTILYRDNAPPLVEKA